MPESFEETTELIVAYLEGTATEKQRASLEDRLSREPNLADRLALQARLSVMLDTLGRQESHRMELADAPRPGRMALWRWSAAGLAAAILVALAVSFVLPSGTAPVAPAAAALRVIFAGPGVEVERGEERLVAFAGFVLAAGDVVRSGAGHPFTLGYAGEFTRLDVAGNSEVYVPSEGPGKQIVARRGEVAAAVAAQPAGTPFAIVTPHARVEILGTKITVQVGPTFTRLEVWEGKALLEKPGEGTSVEVGAGLFAVAEKGRDLGAVPSLTGRERGLKGEYFDDEAFTRIKVTRMDQKIDFEWGFGAPDPAVRPEGFSVRWTGQVLPKFSETYTFTTRTDDGVRLWVDGKLVIDHWHEQGRVEWSGRVDLRAWEPADLRMEYFDRGGPAAARLRWSSPSTPGETVPSDCLLAPLPGTVLHGLKGEYFDNEDFTKPVMTRIDTRIDFTWRLGAPHPSMDPDYFSVRWTGLVEPVSSEATSFHVVSDDGVRLWVDGKLIIDDWKVRGTEERSGTVALDAGKRVEIRLEYFDCVSMAQVHLSWSSPSRRKELVPRDRLIPAP